MKERHRLRRQFPALGHERDGACAWSQRADDQCARVAVAVSMGAEDGKRVAMCALHDRVDFVADQRGRGASV
jgi:hypothetical protein